MKYSAWDKIDYGEIWLQEMGFYDADPAGRKVNDRTEEAFWEGIAPQYAQTNNLFRSVPGLGDAILQLLDEDDVVWEIGSGSANFTIPVAQKVRWVLGIEPSAAMLAAARARIHAEGIENVSFVQKKWEDFSSSEGADVVLSINSFYRIRDIHAALDKMTQYAARRCIVVRSVSRSPLFAICKEAGIPYRCCKDYILMPNILWQQDIAAHVRYISKESTKRYESMEDVCKEFPQGITPQEMRTLQELFLSRAEKDHNGYIYPFRSKFVIMRWDRDR